MLAAWVISFSLLVGLSGFDQLEKLDIKFGMNTLLSHERLKTLYKLSMKW